jgi:integrase
MTTKAVSKTPGMFTRGGVYYARFTVGKTRKWQSTGIRVGESPKAFETARGIVRDLRLAAKQQRFDVLQEVRLRDNWPRLVEVTRAYLRFCAEQGTPRMATAKGNVCRLLRIVSMGAGSADAEAESVSACSRETVAAFVAGMMATPHADERKRRRTIHRYLAQARSLFGRSAMEAYRGLDMPTETIAGFMAAPAGRCPPARREPFTPEEVGIMRAGAELKEKDPAAYAAWFLGFYCALRPSEAAMARRDWLVEMDGRTVLHVGRGGEELKDELSEGYIPLAPDVAAEIRTLGAGGEWMIPYQSARARADVAKRQLADWFRSKGWKRDHCAHELRAYRRQVWEHTPGIGRDVARLWARHALSAVDRSYITKYAGPNVVPLGMGE